MYTTPRSRFRGGTLLGFAAGLLLGLALALAVALYVTRSETPLEDRNTQRPMGSPAQEAEQNRNWNPNAGLSTRPATPAGLQTPEAAAAPPVAPAPAPAAATPAPAADPLAQLIEQRTAAAAAAPVAAGISYFVQAGAFGSAEEAQAQRARLAMLGLEASVSERQQNGRTMFRVRLGPFATQTEADAIGQRLQAQNVETALVRVAR
jgi:cell division protein FtsN